MRRFFNAIVPVAEIKDYPKDPEDGAIAKIASLRPGLCDSSAIR